MSITSPTNSSPSIQAAALFLTIISFSIIQCAAAELVWTWNATNQYSPLSDFRNDADRNSYTVWPEDITDPSFKFPCEDKNSKLQLENFSLQTLQYFDLGIVEHYQPYWIRPKPCGSECWPWDKPAIYCEFNDIYYLYLVRAKRTIFQGVRFGVVMVLIQQIAFAVIGILIPVYCLHRTQGINKMALIARKLLKRLNWGATFVEALHLLALATAGYLLVEGYGHSGDWKISAMNTLAYYYRVQTGCALVSSFLRQCANSMMLITGIKQQQKLIAKQQQQATIMVSNEKHDAEQQGAIRVCNEKKHDGEQKEKKVGNEKHVEMLIAQVVVCVVMVEYLYLIDVDYQNFMIQVVFGVVTVAITVSMSIIISVGGASLWDIVKPVLKKMKTWMKMLIRKLMAKNSGAQAGHLQPQPGTPPV